jgi:hypothetical protein
MSNVAQSKCRCRDRPFLRWFVFVGAIVTIAGSLARFCFSLNAQLSGQGTLQITALVFGSLSLSLIMSSMGMVSSKRSLWEQCAVLAVLLAIVSCSLAFVYDCIGLGKPLAAFYGVGGAGVVSAYEAILVLALCLISLIIQMILVHYDSLQREVTLIIGGSLAVVGILLPKMLESFEVLQAYCAATECDANSRLVIAWYAVALAFSASLAALFVAGVLTPVWRPRLYQLFDPDSPCEICSSLPAHDLIDVPSSEQGDAHGEAEGHGSPVVLDESIVGSVPSAVGVAEPRSSASRQLAPAAVTGVVAGVCFSVASRLFGRR